MSNAIQGATEEQLIKAVKDGKLVTCENKALRVRLYRGHEELWTSREKVEGWKIAMCVIQSRSK